jgi:hypothetical protein
MNPIPNAAPSIPNALARFSAGVTSVIYAIAVGTLEAVNPDTTRPTNNHPSAGANAITM